MSLRDKDFFNMMETVKSFPIKSMVFILWLIIATLIIKC